MTTDEKHVEIFKHQRDIQVRHTYFIMTLSAAAVGYTISLPIPENVNAKYWLLIFALLAWALSIFMGITYIRKMMVLNRINRILFNLESSEKDEKEDLYLKRGKIAGKVFNWMLYFFAIGVASYFFWHLSKLPWNQMFQLCGTA